MNTPTKREGLEERAKQLFDGSVDDLDAAALSRLNRDRHAAVEALQGSRSAVRWSLWVPASGIAAAAIVMALVMRGPVDVGVDAGPMAASDFDILIDDESFEMLEELEFYSWLDAAGLEPGGNVG